MKILMAIANIFFYKVSLNLTKNPVYLTKGMLQSIIIILGLSNECLEQRLIPAMVL